jgi:hypothetical protein
VRELCVPDDVAGRDLLFASFVLASRTRCHPACPACPERCANQHSAPNAAIFASIDNIGNIQPEDRIGLLLRGTGVNSADDLERGRQYVIDVELWDFGTRTANLQRVNQLENFIRARGGEARDRYIGECLVLIRVGARGELLRELLDLGSVAQLDLQPQPSLSVSEMLRVGLADFPPVPEPDVNAPPIAILDSGVTSAHPFTCSCGWGSNCDSTCIRGRCR